MIILSVAPVRDSWEAHTTVAHINLNYAPTAEKLVHSRVQANWKFLRVHAAFISGVALFVKLGITPSRPVVLTIGSIGLVILLLLNIYWAWNILSLKDQSTRKFRVIEAMEKQLSFRPYSAEWDLAGRGRTVRGHLPRWLIELGMPAVMTVTAGFSRWSSRL